MEFKPKTFTPKAVSKSALRHNPYTSGGKAYMYNFKKNTAYSLKSNGNVTSPKKPFVTSKVNQLQIGSSGKFKSFRQTGKNYESRSIKILRESQLKSNAKENSSEDQWLSKPEKVKSSFRSAKRSLELGVNKNSDDPHGIFNSEDEDDDIFLGVRYNKENNNVPKLNNSLNSLQSSTKRKPLNTLHSSILHDISPKRIAVSYHSKSSSSKTGNCSYTFKSLNNKENDVVKSVDQDESPIPATEHPYLIGFLNYGNTCYLNAVLQTLVSLEPFVGDISCIMNRVNVEFISLTKSLWDVINGRRKNNISAVLKALKNLKENVEKIDDSFSGYKMQDANEFLTQVLDTIKDEVDKSINLTYYNDNEPTAAQLGLRSCERKSKKKLRKISVNNNSSLFDTPSPDSLISLDLKLSDCNSSEDERDENLVKNEVNINNIGLTPEKSVNSKFSSSPCNKNQETPAKNIECIINPVKENFEFELLESYRCLGCNDIGYRKQKHFALYVNLPTDGKDSIQHAVESYMMEDQRELTCQKCNHKKASVVTQFENLPRILIVQLKRYEYKPEQLECIKVSSKVEVNMWLQLDSLTSQTGKPPPPWLEKCLSVDTPVETKQRELKLCNTLSVRNLSSELNICETTKEENSINCQESGVSVSSTKSEKEFGTVTPIKRGDQVLEEDIVPSLYNGSDANDVFEHNPDTEEEELQKAIKLSLLEVGMCFSHDQTHISTADDELTYLDNDKLPSEDNKETMLQEINGQHSYRLLSVISHFGLTTCTGHYVADVFNFDENRWFHYDDESVVRLQDSVVLAEGRQKNGYIFFYVHQDVYQKLKS